MKKRIIVVFGGRSSEHDISVITGVEALNAMPCKGYETIPIYIRDDIWYTGEKLFDMRAFKCFNPSAHERVVIVGKDMYKVHRHGKLSRKTSIDCALLALHGGSGENGELQGFFEALAIPYTSTNVRASVICIDKGLTKQALKGIGISVVEGKELSVRATSYEIDKVEAELEYPMIIKPIAGGSSIGISKARNREELYLSLEAGKVFGASVLVERMLSDCVELNIAAVMINNEVIISEIEKISTGNEFLTFDDKYMNGKQSCKIRREFPAKIDTKLKKEIIETTEIAYKKLDLFGVVRFDYLYSRERLYLNEINTIPGSLAHYLFSTIPHSYLLRDIIETAILRGSSTATTFPSEVLTHVDIGSGHGAKLKKQRT
ncbi:MAG: ATP-grasp domain-containing protein [Christensenellaceae bacterium]|nr:ATP-grasp domain-containing protein [Christensenellaceae bacterium]